MSGYIMDPKAVDHFLTQSYSLCKIWQDVARVKVPCAGEALTYTTEETSEIRREMERLYGKLTEGRRSDHEPRKQFTLSAGGPGAGKSVLLEQLYRTDPDLGNAVFSDPDDYALKLMKPFQRDLLKFDRGPLAQVLAYTKWRGASNFISNSIMNRACRDGYDILLGTTATSSSIGGLYDRIKSEGYESRTIIVAAPEDVRKESLRRRFKNEGVRDFAEAVEKGRLFYDRLPVYFEKSDSLSLYWRNKVNGGPALIAEGRDSEIVVYHAGFIQDFEKDVGTIRPDISWNKLGTIYERRVG